MFNFNIAMLMPACKTASRRLTQKSYKKRLLFRKECCWPCDFCGVADHDSQANHTCITFSYLYQITLY